MGLVIPPPSHRLLDPQLAFVAVLSELASSVDLDLLLSPSSGDHDRSFQRMLSGKRVDGVLMMEVRMRDERIDALERSGIPYVLIGRPSESARACSGRTSTTAAWWSAASITWRSSATARSRSSTGPRSCSPPGTARRTGRWTAFEAAAARRGLRAHAFCCSDDAAGGEAVTREILSARPRITAAVTINEGALSGRRPGARSGPGSGVPRDFSLIGVVGERWPRTSTRP